MARCVQLLRLLKPIQQNELIETVLALLGHQGEPQRLPNNPVAVRPPSPEGLASVPLRILIAEDNDFDRDHVDHMLAGQGLVATMVDVPVAPGTRPGAPGGDTRGFARRRRLAVTGDCAQILWHPFSVLDDRRSPSDARCGYSVL